MGLCARKRGALAPSHGGPQVPSHGGPQVPPKGGHKPSHGGRAQARGALAPKLSFMTTLMGALWGPYGGLHFFSFITPFYILNADYYIKLK